MENKPGLEGQKETLKAGPVTLCSLTAALPGEELLCCVCRSETVVPGNRLVSCEKCRHGERAGHLNGPACSSLQDGPYVTCPGLSPQATALARLLSPILVLIRFQPREKQPWKGVV